MGVVVRKRRQKGEMAFYGTRYSFTVRAMALLDMLLEPGRAQKGLTVRLELR